MTFFLHKASGLNPDGSFWSFTMESSGSIAESAAETAWHNAVAGFFGTAGVAATYHTGTRLTQTSTSTASPTFRQTTKTATNATVAGTATTQELPTAVAMVLTTRAGTSDRSSHGRLFLPAPVAAALAIGSGGMLSAGTITTYKTAYGVWKAALSAAGLIPVIVTKRKTGGGLPADSTRNIVGWDFPAKLATQKRRGDKVIGARTTV